VSGAPVLVVAGARPNFMKVAPVLAALRAEPAVRTTLVHTGQHYDREMSRLFFEELMLPAPDVELDVGSGTQAVQTAAVLTRFEPVLLERRPEIVVVVGDVNSTLACSLAAVKVGVPVAHVEAGLRSFDRSMPEEINRVLTDAVSELLFVTEQSGVENLRREGADPSRVHLVGNTMIDTLRRHAGSARASTILKDLALERGRYAVLTLHRPGNVDDPETLSRILAPIRELGERIPVVFPVHPRTRAVLARTPSLSGDPRRLRCLPPMGYLDFLRLMMDARLVLTDSGGIQEETTILGVPCVTLRENTERPVTLSHGTNRLAGTASEGIRSAIAEALSAGRRADFAPPLWDGNAGLRIGDVLRQWLGS
jgi:UDP-N-acetylglucosamine 2-epimerase (non-hydrolysing)